MNQRREEITRRIRELRADARTAITVLQNELAILPFTPNQSGLRADRIVARRKELLMSQTDLANKCKVSRVQISMMETGRSSTTIETLIVLCQALECSADWLLGLTD